MKNVLVVGTLGSNGRTPGGFTLLVNSILDNCHYAVDRDYTFDFLDTAKVKRRPDTAGKIKFENLKNALEIRKDLIYKLKAKKYDVILFETGTGLSVVRDTYFSKLAKQKNKKTKVVVTIHSADYELVFTKKTRKYIFRNMSKYVDGITCLSSPFAKIVKSHISKPQIFVLPNCCKIRLTQDEMDNKINSHKKSKISLLYIGGICDCKGIYDLMNVAREMPERNEFELHIAGNLLGKENEDKFSSLYEKDKDIFYYGYISGDKKHEVLTKADVVVLHSYSEGMPISLLEAISFGNYVVSTDVGGVKEFFGKCGIINQAGDSTALENSIRYLLNNREEMIKKQIENYSYSESFSEKAYIYKLCDIFDDIYHIGQSSDRLK